MTREKRGEILKCNDVKTSQVNMCTVGFFVIQYTLVKAASGHEGNNVILVINRFNFKCALQTERTGD